MGREHIGHADIVRFAQNRVNLPQERAAQYRAQVRGLREKLQKYLAENPDFSLKKMLLSGSLAKRTALRSLNDIDVACYISGADAFGDVPQLLDYLAERLRNAYPNFNVDQVKPQTYSVTVSFRGTGLDVDVVPILYDGDGDWYGNLISQDDGSFLRTCIPRHLEFIRERKEREQNFSQLVRLIKYWVRHVKSENHEFRFKSFMVELILSKLCDEGLVFSDYPEALQHFFTYVVKSELRERVEFSDYCPLNKIKTLSDRIQIIDPVNPENNVGSRYTEAQADRIVEAAMDAGDAIDAALTAPTKEKTVYYWQKVFGPSFQG